MNFNLFLNLSKFILIRVTNSTYLWNILNLFLLQGTSKLHGESHFEEKILPIVRYDDRLFYIL
jgi:hypothetical protein